jgi:hypothetical protein
LEDRGDNDNQKDTCAHGIYGVKANCDAKGFRCRWNADTEKCVSNCECCGLNKCDQNDWNPHKLETCGPKVEFGKDELSPYFCERNCEYNDKWGQICTEKV